MNDNKLAEVDKCLDRIVRRMYEESVDGDARTLIHIADFIDDNRSLFTDLIIAIIEEPEASDASEVDDRAE